MKSASNTLPDQPTRGVTVGVDWATDDHAVSVVDHRGVEIDRAIVHHTRAGLQHLLDVLARHHATEVAIERPDGPIVTTLLDAGLRVVVINPNQIKHLRSRYGSAGNKDDRFDAFVLADTLRTDRARLVSLSTDTDDTITLRRICRARKDLVKLRVATANQLRAHLQHVFPGAVGLFTDIDSPISLTFLTRFTTQESADWLTPTRLAAWLRKISYTGGVPADTLHARLIAAPRGLVGPHADTQAHITHALIAVLLTAITQIKTLTGQITDQLSQHADAHIFTSLPRSGTVRAARLLAEIGDNRNRFPSPEALACLAGVAPSTRQSGKTRSVGFRWACDKQLRDAVTDFAADSRHTNPWAANLYNQARNRQHDHAHATRILARAWLYIIWHCWQNHTTYNPDHHKALQRLLTIPQQAAA